MLYLTDQMSVHDPDFRQSEKDWHTFVEQMTEKLTTIDDTIPELPIKDVVSVLEHRETGKCGNSSPVQVFRIYRDIRFSKDPTPCKLQSWWLPVLLCVADMLRQGTAGHKEGSTRVHD